MERETLYRFLNIQAHVYKHAYVSNRRTISGSIIGSNNTINDNIVILDFNGKDTLNILYNDKDYWYKASYAGKIKKDFFEINLQKRRLPFWPLFERHDVDRVRIGLNSEGQTVIYNYSEHWGITLLILEYNCCGATEYSTILTKVEN